MDTDTTSTGSQLQQRPAAPAFSSAGARAGVCALAARGAESLARGLVTCVFATVGTVLGAITGGLIGLATETGVLRGTGVGGITGALVSMEVVEASLALWRSDEPAIWSVVYVLDVIWSLLSGRLVREKVDPAVLSAVESQVRAHDTLISPLAHHTTITIHNSDLLFHGTLLVPADERSGGTGVGWRPRRPLRHGQHQWHGEGRHRRAPRGDVLRAQQRRHQRRAHRLLGLPPGVRSRRQREEPAGVPPHVPPAVHRRLAAPARLLPLVPAHCLGRAFLSVSALQCPTQG